MDYTLKNGQILTLRHPTTDDAEDLVQLMRQVDTESPFLARNPGEFAYTPEQEAEFIKAINENPNHQWFSAFYQGKMVGQCSAGLISSGERLRHRAGVAFALLRDYWGLGIGGRMMEICLDWCREHQAEQVELDVADGNERAMKMYEGFGFQRIGIKPRALKYPDGCYADEHMMIKYL